MRGYFINRGKKCVIYNISLAFLIAGKLVLLKKRDPMDIL